MKTFDALNDRLTQIALEERHLAGRRHDATSRSRPSVGRFSIPVAGNDGAMRISAVGVIYLVVGAVVAATHDYFENIDTLKRFLSAVLAVVLWPLILIGIDLHVH